MKKRTKNIWLIGEIAAGTIVILYIVFQGSQMFNATYGTKNPVYEPGMKWFFKATFYNLEGNIIRNDTILLKTYDERFTFTQNKLTWTLQKDGGSKIVSHTGFIESDERIWLHPPRFNSYAEFTEYSAFPEIRFPLKSDKSWKTTLTLGSYETEESGQKVDVSYSVKAIDTLRKKPLNKKVKIIGRGKSGLGVYENQMIFTDSLGFTKMTYEKENGEKLILDLIEKTSRE